MSGPTKKPHRHLNKVPQRNAYEIRELDESEFETVIETCESLTYEIIKSLNEGRHDTATQLANKGVHEICRDFGGLGILLGSTVASIELVQKILLFSGPLDGISEELNENPTLKRRNLLEPAIRIAAAIIGEAGGIQGAAMLAIDQCMEEVGEDTGLIIENVWISFCKVAAYGEYWELGLDFDPNSDNFDFLADAQNITGMAAACMLLHKEGYHDLLSEMLLSCANELILPENLALILEIAANDRDLNAKEVSGLYESIRNELEELHDLDDLDDSDDPDDPDGQGFEDYRKVIDYLERAVERASSCTPAKDLRQKIDRIFAQILQPEP